MALSLVQARLLSHGLAGVFLGGEGLRELRPLLAALGLAALARAATVALAEVAAQRASAETKCFLRGRLAARLAERGPLWVSGERVGELSQTVTAGVEALEAFVAQYLPQVALAVLAPLLVLAAVGRADWPSGLVLLVTAPLVPFFMALLGSAAARRTRRQWLELQRLGGTFLDTLTGLATLKSFGRAEAAVARLAAAGEALRAATLGVLRVAFLSSLVLELLATLGTAMVAVGIGLRLLYGRLDFETGLYVLLLTPEFYRPLRSFGAAWHAGMAGREAGARLLEVLDGEAPAPAPVRALAAPGAGPPRVVFEEVSAVYVAGGREVLDRASFTIPAGETLALVGPNGAGKSTAASLLLRFLEPASGRILVDGAPLDSLAVEAWRGRIAWLPQRPTLFHGTLLDNLRLGRPEVDAAAAWAALEDAAARRFVAELPLGLDTPLGEGGQRLSAGQARRIALARAFLRQPDLLVLDEPTAELDPETEEELLPALRRLRAGRTTLLIAHRPASLRDVSRVVSLRDGRVVEGLL